jgi:hypothetical protein
LSLDLQQQLSTPRCSAAAGGPSRAAGALSSSAIPKGGDRLRLIDDLRPLNEQFDLLFPKEIVNLVSVDVLTDLFVEAEGFIITGKMDLSNYYHSIRLPSSWWQMFGLGWVRRSQYFPITDRVGSPGDTWMSVVRTTLPMGFSKAVALAQSIHCTIVRRSAPALTADRALHGKVRGEVPLLADYVWGLYIDDFIMIGIARAVVTAKVAWQQYRAAVKQAGFLFKDPKTEELSDTPKNLIGCYAEPATGRFGLAPRRRAQLELDTLQLLRFNRVTGRALARIVGRWMWTLLPVRHLLSHITAAFAFALKYDTRLARLWPTVVRELETFCILLPLAWSYWKAPFVSIMGSVDASDAGLGVCTHPLMSIDLLAQWVSLRNQEGPTVMPATMQALLNDDKWKMAVSYRWKGKKEHINVLEMRSILTLIHHVLYCELGAIIFPRRLLIFSDSSVSTGAVSKGRSTSRDLNLLLMRLSALCLASGIKVVVHCRS